MKKLLASLTVTASLLASFLVVGPSLASAQNPNDPCAVGSPAYSSSLCESVRNSQNPVTGADGILTRATQFVAYLVGIASIIMIIVGGIRFTTASGDANAVSAAKKQIIYALVGIVVAIFAQALVVLVLK